MSINLKELLLLLNSNDLSVRYYIKNNKNDSVSLRAKAECTPYRVGYDASAFVFKLTHLKTKEDFIEVSRSVSNVVERYSINGKYNKDYIRFSALDFVNLTESQKKSFINDITMHSFSFASFDCCSRFPQCQQNGCTHPDKLYAHSACTVYNRIFEDNNKTNCSGYHKSKQI